MIKKPNAIKWNGVRYVDNILGYKFFRYGDSNLYLKMSEDLEKNIDLASPGNEGGDIYLKECKKHGESLHISLSNEGGYNGTEACIDCLIDIKRNKSAIKNYLKAQKIVKEYNEFNRKMKTL